MKQSLDLKLGQHLTITPQLQQAIRLLQLSSIELQQEIQEALESNPLLEENEREDETPEAKNETELPASDTADANGEDSGESSYDEAEALPATDSDTGPDADSDADWDETFEPMTAPTASRSASDDDYPDIDARNSPPQTLRDHLLWQMQMTPFSDTDKQIALALIDAVNEDGYLSCKLEEIQQALGKNHAIEMDEIEAVLHQIQNFDPLGVGARDLAECLRLQMKVLPPDLPDLKAATELATPVNLALLASRDYTQLRRNLKLTAEELQQAISLIQGLNPRPGNSVTSSQAGYVVPDIVVRKFRGVWRAELNPDVSPRLRINRQYEKMIHRGDSSADNRYLQDQLQQARWFIKSLASRNDTLLKVARTIVDRQRAFFEHGAEAMKPLVLHDVAETVSMHESTISRVTTNKYMLTPRGIFELKYFFSSHVTTADGGTCSATAIRSIIKKLVECETSTKPISDSKIAEILAEQGINVARRTVAKYRESMSIPPSNQRKSLV
ncbi:RNA polymerase factor sigma-54 [Sulfuricaulis limicola]|uniref:RNA polymerase sigma-54 factor n=1 Tax=Sulfuricaulis limicola TaxID=1620215 RepID=A0A1B4XI70_9GAMM|nr:RNA polymerase factor sigma-54 [Sulfuricaulis limicola]BAV34503.1 RNA polymerase factor sigma-54 [Sulfuricaulis limicola]